MINIKLRVLRGLLEECINNIDAGNSNHNEEELDEIIKDLTKLNRGIKRISKREACERILHCSPSTFDNYLKIGLIPPGHKEYEFKKIPANLSIVSPSQGIVISDNPEDMTKEFETMVKISQQTIDSIDYHRGVIENKDSILSILNPRFAKEKEQENKFNALETRVGSMEKGIDDIKTMLSKVLTNK